MKRRTIAELVRVKERMERGEITPARVWEVTRGKGGKIQRRQLDPVQYRGQQKAEWDNTVAGTRSKLQLTQNQFAKLLGISVKTLHNWEQGRRKPTGAARVLLRVASRHPEVVLEEAAA
jgi:ribosome-binding protein aMBF1 (putative translation factor)